jgi:hypothetical protein
MAGITLDQAQTQLTAYLAAETAILGGQSYSINGRELRRAQLAEVQKGIETWNSRVQQLSIRQSGRSRSRTVVAL